MTGKCPVQNFKKIGSELTEKSTKACAPDNCVIDFSYSLSDGGGWSKMKVNFSVSSQSIRKRLSRNFVTIII